VFLEFFKGLFSSSGSIDMDLISQNINPRVTPLMNELLTQVFTKCRTRFLSATMIWDDARQRKDVSHNAMKSPPYLRFRET